jgi:hypothetical protein
MNRSAGTIESGREADRGCRLPAGRGREQFTPHGVRRGQVAPMKPSPHSVPAALEQRAEVGESTAMIRRRRPEELIEILRNDYACRADLIEKSSTKSRLFKVLVLLLACFTLGSVLFSPRRPAQRPAAASKNRPDATIKHRSDRALGSQVVAESIVSNNTSNPQQDGPKRGAAPASLRQAVAAQ